MVNMATLSDLLTTPKSPLVVKEAFTSSGTLNGTIVTLQCTCILCSTLIPFVEVTTQWLEQLITLSHFILKLDIPTVVNILANSLLFYDSPKLSCRQHNFYKC